VNNNEITGIRIKSSMYVWSSRGRHTYNVKYTVTYADGLEIDSSAWYENCTDEMDAVAAVYKKENYMRSQHGV
jgi:hypothetical protein